MFISSILYKFLIWIWLLLCVVVGEMWRIVKICIIILLLYNKIKNRKFGLEREIEV